MKGLRFSAIVLVLLLSAGMLYAADTWAVKDSNAVERVFKSGFLDRNPLTVTFFPGERRVRLSLSSVKNTDTVSIRVFKDDNNYLSIEAPLSASSSTSKSIDILDGKEYYPQFSILFSSDETKNNYRIEILGINGGNEKIIKKVMLKEGSTDFKLRIDEVLSAINGGKAYRIGDRGPAGGYIFYDKGNYDKGWRYLEAAPHDVRGSVDGRIVTCDIDFVSEDGELDYYSFPDAYVFGHSPVKNEDPHLHSDSGKENTEELLEYFSNYSEVLSANPANWKKPHEVKAYGVALCDKLVYNGYDDWFLPSFEELEIMRENLYKKGIGDFGKNPQYAYLATYSIGAIRPYFFIADEYSPIDPLFIQRWLDADSGSLFYVRAVRQF